MQELHGYNEQLGGGVTGRTVDRRNAPFFRTFSSVLKMDAEVEKPGGRIASQGDVDTLALLNQQLIVDEGHRNAALMTLSQLRDRMKGWLEAEYTAVLFDLQEESNVAYALFRQDPEGIYLRQLFVKAEYRRTGLGRSAMNWLKANTWKNQQHVRLDVLVHNASAIAFWRDMGFEDYCITMAWSRDASIL